MRSGSEGRPPPPPPPKEWSISLRGPEAQAGSGASIIGNNQSYKGATIDAARLQSPCVCKVCVAQAERWIPTRMLEPGSSGGHNRSRLTQCIGLQQVGSSAGVGARSELWPHWRGREALHYKSHAQAQTPTHPGHTRTSAGSSPRPPALFSVCFSLPPPPDSLSKALLK